MATSAQLAVYEEIRACIVHLHALRSRRNSFSPIFRLATETLAAIFIQCACDYYHSTSDSRVSAVPCWVNVSYVCRHWRDVALNCPNLWTYLFLLSPRWTDELLARSKQAPLKILIKDYNRYRLGGVHSGGLTPLERLMDHVERIQDFHLELRRCSDPLLFSKFVPLARRLQSLKIVFGISNDRHIGPFYLPPGIDGDETTPVLRSLELSHCPLPWYSFRLSALTTLNLCHVPPLFRKDVVEFMSILGSMQDLTHLYLDDALADMPRFRPNQASGNFPRRISLPRLTRLLITAALSTIAALMSCINIPSGAELRLGCQCSDNDAPLQAGDCILLSSLLADRFHSTNKLVTSCQKIRTLVIRYDSEEPALVFGSLEWDDHSDRTGEGYKIPEWDCGIPLKMFFGVQGRMDGDCIIDYICRSLPLQSVESAHIVYSQAISPDRWGETIGFFPGLRHLELSYGDLDIVTLISMLSISVRDRMKNQGGNADLDPVRDTVFAPALEELKLHQVDFRKWEYHNGSHQVWSGVDKRLLIPMLSTHKTRCNITMTECRAGKSKIVNIVGRWEGEDFKVNYFEPGRS